VTIVIADDGPGVAPHVLARMGEPYIAARGAAQEERRETGGGLGLGLFIAKTLLERSGGELRIINSPAPARGAQATIVWPRASFEGGRQRRQQPIEGGAVPAAR
jgi:two-component system sensor histidine kinase RegB